MGRENQKYDLFISYNISDASIAQRIHDDLKKSNPGIKIFCFQKIKYEPRDFWMEIQEALMATKYFCLLDSPNARNSTWVIRECELAWKLFKAGKIEGFIPVLVKPLGDWRNSSFYKINQTVLQLPNLPKRALNRLEKFIGEVFFSEEWLTDFLKEIECLEFKEVLKNNLQERDLNEQFEEINRIKTVNLSGYTTFDHEGIYKDGMLQLCEVCGFKFYAFPTMLDARDFEDELEALKLEKTNGEILLQDYQAYLYRANFGLDTARKRLEILREECRQLGFMLTERSIAQLAALGIPAETIDDLEKMKGCLYTNEVEFQNALLEQVRENAYDLYYPSIYRNVERGIKFFSLEISLAFLLAEMGELEQAYKIVVEIVEEPKFARDPRGWYALGRLEYYFRKNFHKAIDAFDRSLKIIEENPGNLFLQSNKILILYDKIKPLINLKEIYQVKRILENISSDYHDLSEYKYAQVRSLISLDKVQEAELTLEDLYNRYKNENENWASYKLTESKVKRLKDIGIPEDIITKLQNLKGTIFFSKKAFEENLRWNVNCRNNDKIIEQIIEMAKYDRGFIILSNILASLDFLVYMAMARKRQLIDALYYIERCNEVFPNDLVAKAGLALMHYVFNLPSVKKIIDSGLALKSDRISREDQFAVGGLYYLNGDIENAEKYHPKLQSYKIMLESLISAVPSEWKRKIRMKITELQRKKTSDGLTSYESLELLKLQELSKKFNIN